MRLRKGLIIIDEKGRKGIITDLDTKNGQRVISFDGIEGSQDGWCYKSQIKEIITEYKDIFKISKYE